MLLAPKVKLVEPGTLERSEGKARRVIDDRRLRPGRGAAADRYSNGRRCELLLPTPANVKVAWDGSVWSTSGLLAYFIRPWPARR